MEDPEAVRSLILHSTTETESLSDGPPSPPDRTAQVHTHHISRTVSFLSVLALLFALLSAPMPARAEELLLGPDAAMDYLDDGSDPASGDRSPSSWTQPDFAASGGLGAAGWKNAKGPFGSKYGTLGDLGDGFVPQTLLEQHEPGTQTNHPAYFFRTTFTLSAAQAAGAIKGTAAYDDALRVFVNGHRVAGFDDEAITDNLSFGGANADAPLTEEFTAGPGTIVEGKNTLAFELHQGHNNSTDVYFGLQSLTTAEVTGASEITDPVLQVGGDDTSRLVSWMSASSGGGEVRWAEASDFDGGRLPATAAHSATTTAGRSAEDDRFFNHAALTGLSAGTEYAYQVGSEEDGYSAPRTFTTGSPEGDAEFLAFGDPQIGHGGGEPDDASGWDRTLTSALGVAKDPRFFMSLGDQVESFDDQDQYAQYLAPEATATLAQATTIGNHDFGSTTYEQHFNRPNVGEEGAGDSGESGGDYWFLNSGVLFINLNTNSLDVDAHAAFIDRVVADHGEKARWTVLAFHQSIFSTASHYSDFDVEDLRIALPPVIARNDIDLVLGGHDHVYTRSFLMDADGKPVQDADDGRRQEKQAGQALYLTLTSSSGSKFYDYVPNLEWEAKSIHDEVPGFTRIQVTDESLRATSYEVPVPNPGETTGPAKKVDEVDIVRAGGVVAGADATGVDAGSNETAMGIWTSIAALAITIIVGTLIVVGLRRREK